MYGLAARRLSMHYYRRYPCQGIKLKMQLAWERAQKVGQMRNTFQII